MKQVILLTILLANISLSQAQEKVVVSVDPLNSQNDTLILDSSVTKFQFDDVIITISRDSSWINLDTAKRIRSHWSGIDLGINGLLNSKGSTDLSNPIGTPAGDITNFMELDYRHSWMFRLNLMEMNIRTKSERLGILTGLGFEWNSYELKHNVQLLSNGRHFVDPNVSPFTSNYTWGVIDSINNYSKNRFKTISINVPLLLDITLGKEKDFFIAVGPVFSYNLKSKMKYKSDEGKNKVKQDFNVSPFSMSLTARVGYKSFTAFASYNATPLFEKDKGPELYPFSAGITLIEF